MNEKIFVFSVVYATKSGRNASCVIVCNSLEAAISTAEKMFGDNWLSIVLEAKNNERKIRENLNNSSVN